MISKNFRDKFQNFNQKNVLIIGDVMVDSYLHGNVDRISPEAPVPVVHVTKKEEKSGGAANVALNILALGAKAHMCSVVGQDSDGDNLTNLLHKKGVNCDGLLKISDRPTTVKTRILSNGQQILRVDNEEIHPISSSTENQLIDYVKSQISVMDMVILEDYNKGLMTSSFIQNIIKTCNQNNIPVVVDPKKENFLEYKNVSLFKPNRKEIIEGLNIDGNLKDKEDIEKAILKLHQELGANNVMVTLSEDGVVISDGKLMDFIPAHKRKIYDVSGAGDTVISVASLCMASGMSNFEVAAISNIAGGLVCEKPGVVQVDKDLLIAEIAKIYDL